jgi:hypothetical protein
MYRKPLPSRRRWSSPPRRVRPPRAGGAHLRHSRDASCSRRAWSRSLACGDDGATPTPVPPTVTLAPVTIATDPLTLTVTPGRGAPLVQPGSSRSPPWPTSIPGTTTIPRVTGADALAWTRPTRAVAVDGEWLVLEGGARLRLGARHRPPPTPGSTVDAAAVPDAVLTRLTVPMAAGEPIYGFGESFGGADATGQVRERSSASPTSSSRA